MRHDVLKNSPLTVATVHSPASIEAAMTLAPDAVDLLEVRADALCGSLPDAVTRLVSLGLPFILTARGPAEGGENSLTPATRGDIYHDWMSAAAFIDIELQDAETLSSSITSARDTGRTVILSHHDFKATPSIETLRSKHALARQSGADIFKVAAYANTPADLACLHTFTAEAETPVSVMGMGPLGMISRLLLAKAGSCLNYGYLATPNAPGQWPAVTLRQRIQELA